MSASDLTRIGEALARYDARVGARRIQAGDEAAFVDPRGAPMASRRASGAARIVARKLLGELASDACAPLERAPGGAPIWPEGVLGSLAHDEAFAAAAVTRSNALKGIGVDIEPAEPLPRDVLDFVLSHREWRAIDGDPLRARMVFSAKEAVYKAVNPLDGSSPDYADIEVNLVGESAVLRDGRQARLVMQMSPRALVVALL